MNSNKNLAADIIGPLLLIILCIVLYINTLTLPPPLLDVLGDAFFPRLAIYALAALSFILLVQTIIKKRKIKIRSNDEDEDKKKPLYKLSWGLVGTYCIYTFILSFNWLNYITATIIFLPIFMLIIGIEEKKINWIAFLSIALFGSFGIAYIIQNLLGLFLP